MKKLVVIIIVLALLGGGGFAAYKFLGIGAPPEGAEGEDVAAVAEFDEPIFVDMAPFNIPVVRDGELAGYVNVTIVLEVADDDAEDVVIDHMPKLREAIFRDLYATLPMRRGDVAGFDPPFVKKRLLEISDRAVGRGQVTAVLIQTVFEAEPGPRL